MNTLADKLIVFDGNCYLCRNGAKLSVQFSSFPEEKLSAYDSLSPELQAKVDQQRFKNEMAVVDLNEKHTLYGLDGILFVLGTKYRFLKAIKPNGLFYKILRVIYRTIAYNRYILFPINSLIKCDCQPPLNKFYRIVLFSFCAIFSLLISSLLGYSIGAHIHHQITTEVIATLGAVGAGWIAQLLTATLFLKGEQFYDYLGHIGVIMFVGVLVLIPGLIGAYLPPLNFFPLMGLCILISCTLMTRMHSKRARIIGLNKSWTYSWFFFLQLSVIITLALVLKSN